MKGICNLGKWSPGSEGLGKGEGKGNSEEEGITGERGKRRKDGSLRSESCENQFKAKCPALRFFNLI